MWHRSHVMKIKTKQSTRWAAKTLWGLEGGGEAAALVCQGQGIRLYSRLYPLTQGSSQASPAPLLPDSPSPSPAAGPDACSTQDHPHHWRWKWWETGKRSPPSSWFLAPIRGSCLSLFSPVFIHFPVWLLQQTQRPCSQLPHWAGSNPSKNSPVVFASVCMR